MKMLLFAPLVAHDQKLNLSSSVAYHAVSQKDKGTANVVYHQLILRPVLVQHANTDQDLHPTQIAAYLANSAVVNVTAIHVCHLVSYQA